MANYIIIGGDNKEYGPVNEAEVRQWLAEGRLNRESRMKAESDAEFRALAQFPEFATALNSPGTPGVIAPPLPGFTPDAGNWEAEVLARQPELRLGECLAAGWSFLGANLGFLAGAVLLTSVLNFVLALITVAVPLIGPMVMLCFHGVVMGGFYLACLRRQRGENVAPSGVLAGFKEAFAQLLLVGLISALLTEFSVCCFVLPAVYLGIAWSFAVPLVADKKLFFWAAMELSRKTVTRVWFEVFIMLALTFLPMLLFQLFNYIYIVKYGFNLWDQAGHDWQQWAQMLQTQNGELRKMTILSALIGQAVLTVNLFYCAGVIARAYENLFGTKKS